jgi:phage tail P2-like protein
VSDPTVSLLPACASAFEQAQSETSARLLGAPVATIPRERQPANCDDAFLPPLAWERSVHCWNPGDDAGNRARVESAFQDHLGYGSPTALEAEIALDTGLEVAVKEFWTERDMAWPGFAVETPYAPGTPAPDMDALYASTVRRCNVRDWPRVRPLVTQDAPLYVGAASRLALSAKVLTAAKIPLGPFVGAAQRLAIKQKVMPH